MSRRRSSTTRLLGTAVGALLAAAALTACSGAPHPGAAAVVGGERITTSAVEARVAAFRADSAALPGSGQAQQEASGLLQKTVYEMVLSAVVAQATADHGLTVSDAEIAQARASDAAQLGGDSQLAEALLSKQGVPAADIDGFYREQLGIQKIASQQGGDMTTPAGNELVRKTLAEASAKLKVEVNPRYGSWNAEQVSLNDSHPAWLKAAAPVA